MTLLRRALEVALEGDYTTAAFRAWNNLAVTLEGDDRYREVAELNTTTLEMARRKGDRSSELAALLGYCAPLVALGRWDEAIAFADEAQTAEELEAMGGRPFVWASWSRCTCVVATPRRPAGSSTWRGRVRMSTTTRSEPGWAA